MIDGIFIEDFESFLDWYSNLEPKQTPDLHEAMTIYFNLETYDTGDF